jgi:hypothetical protein
MHSSVSASACPFERITVSMPAELEAISKGFCLYLGLDPEM